MTKNLNANSLKLLALFLISSFVMTQITWPKLASVQHIEQTWPHAELTPAESALGFGLLSTPVSLGTDNFYFISGANHTKDPTATAPAREYRAFKI